MTPKYSINTTGHPDVDTATAEIALILHDAGWGRHGACYSEAERLRGEILKPLRAVHALMSGQEWSPDTLDSIARILESVGMPIDEVAEV
jgi:hypothetical protein